jgi:hypothetical protein
MPQSAIKGFSSTALARLQRKLLHAVIYRVTFADAELAAFPAQLCL